MGTINPQTQNSFKDDRVDEILARSDLAKFKYWLVDELLLYVTPSRSIQKNRTRLIGNQWHGISCIFWT